MQEACCPCKAVFNYTFWDQNKLQMKAFYMRTLTTSEWLFYLPDENLSRYDWIFHWEQCSKMLESPWISWQYLNHLFISHASWKPVKPSMSVVLRSMLKSAAFCMKILTTSAWTLWHATLDAVLPLLSIVLRVYLVEINTQICCILHENFDQIWITTFTCMMETC